MRTSGDATRRGPAGEPGRRGGLLAETDSDADRPVRLPPPDQARARSHPHAADELRDVRPPARHAAHEFAAGAVPGQPARHRATDLRGVHLGSEHADAARSVHRQAAARHVGARVLGDERARLHRPPAGRPRRRPADPSADRHREHAHARPGRADPGRAAYALEPIAPVETALGSIEFNPPFLQAAGHDRHDDRRLVRDPDRRRRRRRHPLPAVRLGVPAACRPRRAQRPLSALEQANAAHNAVRVRDGLGEVPGRDLGPVPAGPLDAGPIVELAPGDLVALPHRVTARSRCAAAARPTPTLWPVAKARGSPAWSSTRNSENARDRIHDRSCPPPIEPSSPSRPSSRRRRCSAELPVGEPLTLGAMTQHRLELDGQAVSVRFSGARTGELLIAVDQPVLDALAASPLGPLDPSHALTPALEAAAGRSAPSRSARLKLLPVAAGARRPARQAGASVLVPLLADGGVAGDRRPGRSRSTRRPRLPVAAELPSMQELTRPGAATASGDRAGLDLLRERRDGRHRRTRPHPA